MYRVSDELLKAIKNNTAHALISFDLVSGSVSDITNDDIAALSIERTSVSGKSLEIGAARAFEMTLRLNADEKFKGVRFEGAEARVRIGYTTSQGVEYIPLGVFTVDGSEKQSGEIELAALDRMVKFDRDADFSDVVFPVSVESLALRACYACGIDTSRLNLSEFPNASYSVEQAPGACTWRRVLMWCLEIMGVCAYIDAEGYIVAKWYEDTGEKLTASDRFDHKIHENDVVVHGVQVIDDEETAHLVGEASGFVFTIEGNELLTHDHDAVASNLAAVLVGFRHRPFEAEVLPHPHLFPLDMLTYIDEDGEEVAVCVSGCVFTMNDNTELTGAGESETTSGYASLDPMTERERTVVAAALKKQEAAIVEKTGGIVEQKAEALTRMNEVVANALGLYAITYTEADGSTQTYFCNKPTLVESSLIYVFNAGGFAWTDAWGGSNAATVWNYGITKDGNAVLNYLSLNRLTADYIDATNLSVSASLITGELKIGNLPSTVAQKSDIPTVPTKTSDLTNDSGFQTYSNVVSIVDGKITADKITVNAARINGKITADQIDTTTLKVTAVGEIGAFEIDGEKLSNIDGNGSIEIKSGDYVSTLYSDGFFVGKEDDTKGAWITATAISISETDETSSGVALAAKYTKKSGSDTEYGKSETVHEAAITPIRSAYLDKDNANSSWDSGSLIIGAPRLLAKTLYPIVNQWGAYFRVANYNRIELCYDSTLGGAVVIKDVATGKEYNLTALVK